MEHDKREPTGNGTGRGIMERQLWGIFGEVVIVAIGKYSGKL
jgi:hypothetical protein